MTTDSKAAERRFLRTAAILGGLFILIRVLFLRQATGTPVVTIPILDSEFYYAWAKQLAAGHGHPAGPFWLSPLYPVFLSGIFKAFGSISVSLALAIQCLLSLGTLAAVAYYTRRLFGDAAALVTIGLAALYAPWLYYDGVMLSGSLILFLNAAMLLLIIERGSLIPREDPGEPAVTPLARDAAWAAIGLICGLSALARPSVLIFAAILTVWLIVQDNPFRLRRIVFFVIALSALIVPILMRNLRESGSLLLTTSSGGVNFFIGNRAGATGVYDELDFVPSFDPAREAEGYRVEAENRTGRPMTLNQASRYWAGQAFDDMLHSPGGWLRLEFRKLWLTVQRDEIQTNLSFRGAAGFVPILGALPIRWGLLFPLAAAGMFLAWRKRKDLRLLWLYGISYLAVNLVFFSASEYRLPLILILLPAAGCFFVEMWRIIAARDFRRLAFGGVVYLLGLIVVNAPSRFVAHTVKPTADYHNMAVEAEHRGEPMAAVSLYARALTADAEYRPARERLADLLWRMGNYDDARAEYQRLGEPAPDEVSGSPLETFLQELYFHTEESDYDGALELLNKHFPPDSVAPKEIWANRAMVEDYLGQYKNAMRSLDKGAALEPDSPQWPYKAGEVALRGRDSSAARQYFEKAISVYPAYAPARLELGKLALAMGDSAMARSQLDELRKIKIPQDSLRMQVWRFSLNLGNKEPSENF